MATMDSPIHAGTKIVADDNPSVYYVATADYTIYRHQTMGNSVMAAFEMNTSTAPDGTPLWVVSGLVGTLTFS